VSTRFNAITAFIGRCAMQSAEQSQEYQALQRHIDEAKERAHQEKDRNKRAKPVAQLESAEKKF